MPDQFVKAITYLKTRGPGEFLRHAQEKAADAAYDYDKLAKRRQVSPLRSGWQKTLQLKDMPTIWVMLLREDQDQTGEESRSLSPGLTRQGTPLHRTLTSVRRQTYAHVEVSDRLTTRTRDRDLVVFVREGDLLTEDALYALAAAAQDGADCLYSDRDRVCFRREGGRETCTYSDPFYKPDFDPDYLRSVNYMSGLYAVRAGLLRAADKVSFYPDLACGRTLADPAAAYEMVLLTTELAKGPVLHLPRVLCHRSMDRPGRREQVRRVLKRDLARQGRSAIVETGPGEGAFHLTDLTRGNPLVTIVIPNRDQAGLLRACLDSIRRKATWGHLEIVVVENGSREPETFALYEGLQQGDLDFSPFPYPVVVATYEKAGFNFSDLVNLGVEKARGEYVILMNNDVTVKSPDFIERLLGQCMREGVGAAGPRLLYPDGRVQSAGIVIGLMGYAGSMMVGEQADKTGSGFRGRVTRQASAVTAACMMVKRAAFRQVGGFCPDFAVALNDVDFCLRLREAGYRILYDPSADLVHHESRTRGYETSREKRRRFLAEQKRFRARWGRILKEGDPFYNRNLSLRKCDFSPETRHIRF